LVFAATLAIGQSDSIHQQIKQIYNFQPHSLSDHERAQKSALLDQFWHRAEARGSEYVPALRQELADFENPPFFLYDGSMLLLSLSDTSADRKIALAAMARCDLRDVQSKDYFYQVHRMATLDEDTTAAAFHILTESKFQVFIPQHVLTLAQNYALIYLLLPTDQDHWLQPAIQRLKSEPDQTAQQTLLLLLWYAQTDAADAAITDFGGDVGKPPVSRTYAQELLQRKDAIGRRERSEASHSSELSLRQKRQDCLRVVSDEALVDLDDYTMILMAKRK
jgi:hypothetical protein